LKLDRAASLGSGMFVAGDFQLRRPKQKMQTLRQRGEAGRARSPGVPSSDALQFRSYRVEPVRHADRRRTKSQPRSDDG